MKISGGRVFDLKRGFVERDVCFDGGALGQVHQMGGLDELPTGLVEADVAVAANAQQLQAGGPELP